MTCVLTLMTCCGYSFDFSLLGCLIRSNVFLFSRMLDLLWCLRLVTSCLVVIVQINCCLVTMFELRLMFVWLCCLRLIRCCFGCDLWIIITCSFCYAVWDLLHVCLRMMLHTKWLFYLLVRTNDLHCCCVASVWSWIPVNQGMRIVSMT